MLKIFCSGVLGPYKSKSSVYIKTKFVFDILLFKKSSVFLVWLNAKLF